MVVAQNKKKVDIEGKINMMERKVNGSTLSIKNVQILYWNCASVKQCCSILEWFVYETDNVALQEAQLGDSSVLRIASFQTYYKV